MTKYYIELGGRDSTLQEISKCFKSPSFQIFKRSTNWILISEEFEAYDSYNEVLSKAHEIIKKINILLAVYGKLHNSIQVKNVVWLSTDGKYKRHIISTISVEVYSSSGIDKLSDIKVDKSFGSKILSLSESNQAVKQLLSLITEDFLKWGEIYDVIEFMGDSKGIVRWGFATKKEVNRIRRTANYYRHLGKPDKSILPSELVTLKEARDFAEDLICKWLNMQVN